LKKSQKSLLAPFFIDGAQKRLFVAVQELDSREIAEALIRARARVPLA